MPNVKTEHEQQRPKRDMQHLKLCMKREKMIA